MSFDEFITAWVLVFIVYLSWLVLSMHRRIRLLQHEVTVRGRHVSELLKRTKAADVSHTLPWLPGVHVHLSRKALGEMSPKQLEALQYAIGKPPLRIEIAPPPEPKIAAAEPPAHGYVDPDVPEFAKKKTRKKRC